MAYRGPLANKFRERAERHELSLARLLQDAMLADQSQVAEGYQPGTKVEEWTAGQGRDRKDNERATTSH